MAVVDMHLADGRPGVAIDEAGKFAVFPSLASLRSFESGQSAPVLPHMRALHIVRHAERLDEYVDKLKEEAAEDEEKRAQSAGEGDDQGQRSALAIRRSTSCFDGFGTPEATAAARGVESARAPVLSRGERLAGMSKRVSSSSSSLSSLTSDEDDDEADGLDEWWTTLRSCLTIDLGDREPGDWMYDTPLTRRGLAMARHTGTHLARAGIDMVLCSPALRCVQTAHELCTVLNLEFYIEPALFECASERMYPLAMEENLPSDIGRGHVVSRPLPQTSWISVERMRKFQFRVAAEHDKYEPIWGSADDWGELVPWGETLEEYTQRCRELAGWLHRSPQFRGKTVLLVGHKLSLDRIPLGLPVQANGACAPSGAPAASDLVLAEPERHGAGDYCALTSALAQPRGGFLIDRLASGTHLDDFEFEVERVVRATVSAPSGLPRVAATGSKSAPVSPVRRRGQRAGAASSARPPLARAGHFRA